MKETRMAFWWLFAARQQMVHPPNQKLFSHFSEVGHTSRSVIWPRPHPDIISSPDTRKLAQLNFKCSEEFNLCFHLKSEQLFNCLILPASLSNIS